MQTAGRRTASLCLSAAVPASRSSPSYLLSSSSSFHPSVATSSPSTSQVRSRSTVSPAYAGHVPINTFQRSLLAVGSAVTSLIDPYRHDMVAVLGETTSNRQLPKMRDALLKGDEEGRRLLRERPRLNTETIDLNKLRGMQEGSFGRAYVAWLERCGVSPDTRDPVRYIDDPELAYIMQRYRECHDFYHVLLGFPVSVSAELVVKWFELSNMGLPVAFLSSFFGPLRVKSDRRRRLVSTYMPWALRAGANSKPLIGVYWEERWSMDIGELRKELGIPDPPLTWQQYRDSSPFTTKPKV
ncbi:Ubiquinone biosynthesis COQ4, mitochondrial [Olea europaea subsp. europaea]|uniref:Ubiquinone biosynthesis protein COQ4 homolog, mitochondrial n=1 Tax=Olea europaea subsp. europaea TaxID=158383 RepID=A0A8S0VGD4_OLEEU|nr:Ubiquinone biosynthesis COQ4, mitochondrial [Olea europaea subsp. europaea]